MSNNLQKMCEKHRIELYHGCVEPRYDDKPVALGNWNNINGKVSNALELLGYEIEWEDEWASCGDCGKVVRTNPNSYGWTQYFAIIGECELVCGDCIKEFPYKYLEGIENNPNHCTTFDLPLEDLGYKMVEEDFESGFHPGQNDKPSAILERLLKNDPKGRYIFVLDEQSQFYIGFSVWKKIEED